MLFGNALTVSESASELNSIKPVGTVTLTSEDWVVYEMNIYPDNNMSAFSNDSSVQYTGFYATNDMKLVNGSYGNMGSNVNENMFTILIYMPPMAANGS